LAERSSTAVVLVLVLLLVGLLLIVPMFGMWMWGPTMMGGGMMGGWSYVPGWNWGFMFAGMLVPLLFIILLVIGAYMLLSRQKEPTESEKAIVILNERYARGEITREQYLEMKENLAKK